MTKTSALLMVGMLTLFAFTAVSAPAGAAALVCIGHCYDNCTAAVVVGDCGTPQNNTNDQAGTWKPAWRA
jgi:hypothetical protein